MKRYNTILTILAAACTCGSSAIAQIVISGNENKIDLSTGGLVVHADANPDSLTILDFSSMPPKIQHLKDIANSVIGPPSNIGIAPNGELALITSSVKIDPNDATAFVPDSVVHILDLSQKPAKVIGTVTAGLQPSGISFTPNGKLAFVANRGAGSISVLKIEGKQVNVLDTVTVCDAKLNASDVAVSPDGKMALVSVQAGGYLAVLKIDGEKVTVTDRKLSVAGKPYRVVISPDGKFGLTAGQGFGSAIDDDALSVVDLSSDIIKTIDYITLGPIPESIEISPDGKLVAATLMDGSNLTPDDPSRREQGTVVLLARRGNSFKVVQKVSVGRIPQGVAFTSDGKHLVVQSHAARQLHIFEVVGEELKKAGEPIKLPGRPCAIRASK